MIFVGDIALASDKGINFKNFPSDLKNNTWIVNLEGAIVSKPYEKGVYNNITAFKNYINNIPIHVACLANNHITDTEPISETKSILSENNIKFIGAGNSRDFNKEVVVGDFVLINFAWPVIQAIPVSDTIEGVNPLSNNNVLKEFSRIRKTYKDKKIGIIFHWNFELELFPMPRQRELAKHLIDNGAELIIGHHSHLVQGIETYKGKYIVHGLGNWAFEQDAFQNGSVRFPDTSLRQCAFEYNDIENSAKVHLFNYERKTKEISFIETKYLKNNSSFEADYQGLNEKDYLQFFKKNRIKRKYLPIYKWSDSNTMVKLKDIFMLLRDKGISVLK